MYLSQPNLHTFLYLPYHQEFWNDAVQLTEKPLTYVSVNKVTHTPTRLCLVDKSFYHNRMFDHSSTNILYLSYCFLSNQNEEF